MNPERKQSVCKVLAQDCFFYCNKVSCFLFEERLWLQFFSVFREQRHSLPQHQNAVHSRELMETLAPVPKSGVFSTEDAFLSLSFSAPLLRIESVFLIGIGTQKHRHALNGIENLKYNVKSKFQ